MTRISLTATRRAFLRRGVATSIAFAVPYFVPRHVLGMTDAPSANEQIVVGIIGVGVRGTQLASNITAAGRIAAICDVDARKTAALLTKYQERQMPCLIVHAAKAGNCRTSDAEVISITVKDKYQ